MNKQEFLKFLASGPGLRRSLLLQLAGASEVGNTRITLRSGNKKVVVTATPLTIRFSDLLDDLYARRHATKSLIPWR